VSGEGFVHQAKEPGAEAEVDFGQVSIVLGDDQVACHLFAYRLSYSGEGVRQPERAGRSPAVEWLMTARKAAHKGARRQ
jgi:hypothetical protein